MSFLFKRVCLLKKYATVGRLMESLPKKIGIGVVILVIFAIAAFIAVRASNNSKTVVGNMTISGQKTIPSVSQGQATAPHNSADPAKIYTTPVLVYHTIGPINAGDSASVKRFKVTPETFEKQLQYLKDNNYTTLTFGSFADMITKGEDVPPKTVVLTFDDALDTQYANAYPLLKKYGMTGTFFVYTIVLGHKKFMTWDQVIEVDKAGIEIGSHTKSHAYLIKADEAALAEELAGSKKTIEEKLGHPITTLAYPFYQFNEGVEAAVKAAGYVAARAGWKQDPNSIGEIYALGGIEVSNDFSKFAGYLR